MDKLALAHTTQRRTDDGSAFRRHQRQKKSVLITSALGVAALCGCTVLSSGPTPERETVLHYHSTDPAVMQGTLRLGSTRERISAITHLAEGGCLSEEVQLDPAGRVLGGKAALAAPDLGKLRDVVVDAARGSVEVTTPSFHIYWSVPRDLPWAWPSLLSSAKTGAPLATPLGAMVAQRAAATNDALRLLDVSTFQSHSVMADQVLVPEDNAATVVLGDDWAELLDGVPTRMHLDGIETLLEEDDPQLSSTLAACDCTHARPSHLSRC